MRSGWWGGGVVTDAGYRGEAAVRATGHYAWPVSQTMKPVTAAAKLGIYLPAAPEEFRTSPITRDQLDALRADPPQWLVDLRRTGPFPREVVARKLGVSRSGLARSGLTEALDADQIGGLIDNPPDWLVREREIHREVNAEKARRREKDHIG